MTEVVRWAARLLGAGLVLLAVMMAVGEGIPRFSALSTPEALQMGVMFVILAGLLAAWRWPAVGGGIVLAGLAAFEAVEWRKNAHLALGWVFVLFAVAGLLHLLSARPQHGAAAP